MPQNDTIPSRERQPQPAPPPPEHLPRHVAIIMDGNGRWAQARGKARSVGHRHGARAVRLVVTESAKLGLDVLTLYSFSIENWKRPKDEVDALMELYLEYLVAETEEMVENNIRFRQIGRRDDLPQSILRALDQAEAATAKCTGMTLCVALNYGSRTEITDAVRAIARKVAAGEIDPEDPEALSERTISEHLYTAGLPDPDLLIRTAGEMRVSNYLLWQISYAELWVTDTLWPDFTTAHLHDALRAYGERTRRFGAVV
jgi:undecaprenyl diphosphate synthase